MRASDAALTTDVKELRKWLTPQYPPHRLVARRVGFGITFRHDPLTPESLKHFSANAVATHPSTPRAKIGVGRAGLNPSAMIGAGSLRRVSDWSFYDRGLSLFPLTPRTKRPALDWEPFQHRRASADLVAAWRQNQWNTGIATGAVSGVIVLDCDNALARALAEAQGLPRTLTIATPRGTHFYFNHPGWDVRNRAGRSWTVDLDGTGVDGWDLRGDGGYVVGPGSHYIPTPEESTKGKIEGTYRVELDAPIADAPDWLLALTFPKFHKQTAPARVADKTSEYGRAALNGEMQVLMAVQSGSINEQVNLSAFAIGQLVAGGEITSEEGWGALWEALAVLGIQDEEKAQGTLERGWTAGMQLPRAVEHPEAVTPEQALGHRDPIAPPPPITPAAPVDLTRPFVPPVKPAFVLAGEMYNYFRGCVYLARRDEMFHPTGVLVGKSAFDALYGGPTFSIDHMGEKPERSAWTTFRQNSHTEMPKAWDMCFRPELAPGTIVDIAGLPYLNVYVPVVTPRIKGDASRFEKHVRKMLPNGHDADLLLHWMASAVQNPGAKFQWWPVVQGVKGNGKSILLDCMVEAIGERYSHKVRADSIIKTSNQFNDWIERKLFLGFEEIRTSDGKRDFVEIMKDTVTARRLATEGKGKGQATSDNRANGMMLTNHDDAVPVDDDERRWGVFYCAQQKSEDLDRDGMGVSYFVELYRWLQTGGYAVVTDFLATMPLREAMDPARGLQRAPETTSTREAIGRSLGVVEQEILEAIDSGTIGFRGGVITSLALRQLFERLRKTIGPRRYKSIMLAVGYDTHPAFEASRGRPNNPLFDGTKPVLYFQRGGDILATENYGDVVIMAERILRGENIEGPNVIPFRRP